MARGHRRIGGIFKSDDMQGLARYEGYTRGLLRHGITLQDQWVTWFNSESRDNLLTDEYGVSRLLGKIASCTAVVCYNDAVAVKLEKAFAAHGVRVPQDKAIISFDNSQLGELASVGLTSFDHPKESMGACAARKLISMMSGREETSTVMDWGLAERNSV